MLNICNSFIFISGNSIWRFRFFYLVGTQFAYTCTSACFGCIYVVNDIIYAKVCTCMYVWKICCWPRVQLPFIWSNWILQDWSSSMNSCEGLFCFEARRNLLPQSQISCLNFVEIRMYLDTLYIVDTYASWQSWDNWFGTEGVVCFPNKNVRFKTNTKCLSSFYFITFHSEQLLLFYLYIKAKGNRLLLAMPRMRLVL
jgi:hypothetical protein